MKFGRFFFWLILIPGGLLYFAWRMSWHVSDVNSGALEAREREQHMASLMAENERQNAIYLKERIEKRRTLASTCVARALRTLGGDLHTADATLVIVSHRGCGAGCDTEAVASRLVDEYVLHRLQVLLIRTRDDGNLTTPLGVHTVTVTDCAPLASDYGDDFFFRDANGQLSSSGERHEGRMLGRSINAGFDPEPLVREGLGLSSVPY